jgi:hypothetical protein
LPGKADQGTSPSFPWFFLFPEPPPYPTFPIKEITTVLVLLEAVVIRAVTTLVSGKRMQVGKGKGLLSALFRSALCLINKAPSTHTAASPVWGPVCWQSIVKCMIRDRFVTLIIVLGVWFQAVRGERRSLLRTGLQEGSWFSFCTCFLCLLILPCSSVTVLETSLGLSSSSVSYRLFSSHKY